MPFTQFRVRTQDVAAQAGWGTERAGALARSQGKVYLNSRLRQGAKLPFNWSLLPPVPSVLTQLKPTLFVAGSVRYFPFPGLVQVQNGSKEAIVMHVYVKRAFRRGKVLLREFMFAESTERDW